MRRWIAGLHGGQLVMLVVGIAAVGGSAFAVAHGLAKDADVNLSLYGKLRYGAVDGLIQPDTTLANLMLKEGVERNRLALRWGIAGAAVLLTIVPTLWVWFGARRRHVIVAEAIDA